MKRLLFIALLCSATLMWAGNSQRSQPEIAAGAFQDDETQQMGGPETPEVNSPGVYGDDPTGRPDSDSDSEAERDPRA